MKPPAKRYKAYHVTLDDRHAHTLTLRRAPPYLRFVMAGDDWKTLDALDQLDDEPKPEERVIVAERVEQTPCHIRASDKAKCGWHMQVKYTSIADQPPELVSRTTSLWQAWCQQRWSEK